MDEPLRARPLADSRATTRCGARRRAPGCAATRRRRTCGGPPRRRACASTTRRCAGSCCSAIPPSARVFALEHADAAAATRPLRRSRTALAPRRPRLATRVAARPAPLFLRVARLLRAAARAALRACSRASRCWCCAATGCATTPPARWARPRLPRPRAAGAYPDALTAHDRQLRRAARAGGSRAPGRALRRGHPRARGDARRGTSPTGGASASARGRRGSAAAGSWR